MLDEPGPPLGDSRRRTADLSGDILIGEPSPQASTIRERKARACDDLRRRAHLVSCSRSSGVRSSSALERPVRAIPYSATCLANFRRSTLALSLPMRMFNINDGQLTGPAFELGLRDSVADRIQNILPWNRMLIRARRPPDRHE